MKGLTGTPVQQRVFNGPSLMRLTQRRLVLLATERTQHVWVGRRSLGDDYITEAGGTDILIVADEEICKNGRDKLKKSPVVPMEAPSLRRR